MALNTVAISGNLTRDPEFRATQSGSGVLSFSVAVNERQKSRETGEWEDYPSYIDCVVFGKRAESLSNMLHKGSKVAVSGRLHQNRWTDAQTGKGRSKVEVHASEVIFMSARGESSQPEYEVPVASPAAQAQAAELYDADIPF